LQSGMGAKAGFVLPAMLLAAIGAVARGKDKKNDPEQIGNRDHREGSELLCLWEKEIAFGTQMAHEVERGPMIMEDRSSLCRMSTAPAEYGGQPRCEDAVCGKSGGLWRILPCQFGRVSKADTEAELSSVVAR
jgi:hypothetical protein